MTTNKNVQALVDVLKTAMEGTKVPGFLKDNIATRVAELKGTLEKEIQAVMTPAYVQALIRKTVAKLVEQLILSELGIDTTWSQARFSPNSDAAVSKTIKNFAAEETTKILNKYKVSTDVQKILEEGIEREMKERVNRYDSSVGQFVDGLLTSAYAEMGVKVDKKSRY